MSTVNFSVPEEVKRIFNETFEGQNKSAVIAGLMLEAVERARRKRTPTLTQKEFRAAREAGRS